ncbi:sulfotransferase [Nocardia sp. NPDC052566]|uniref:sulfotransferase n=1 Tax=Nocardia sp. NPDC052566 TaxID=3364330 RepID=UPI0037CC3A9E
MSSHPPLLLVGAQRSGTTALASVLDAAFDTVGGIFTINGKLAYLLQRWCTDADIRGRHFRADEILHALDRKQPYGTHSVTWRLRVERVLRTTAARVARGGVADAGALRRSIIEECYAPASRYGEKYNEHLLELEALSPIFPDAHWLLLIRHPAAVAASMLRWRGDRPWRPVDRADALAKWADWHGPWLGLPWTADPTRCTVLDYDSLCRGDGLGRLSAAIDLNLAPFAAGLIEHQSTVDHSLPKDIGRVWNRLLDQAHSSNTTKGTRTS